MSTTRMRLRQAVVVGGLLAVEMLRAGSALRAQQTIPCSYTISGAASGTAACHVTVMTAGTGSLITVGTAPSSSGTPADMLTAAVGWNGGLTTGHWTDATVTQSAVAIVEPRTGKGWIETSGTPRQGTMSIAITSLGKSTQVGPMVQWNDVAAMLTAQLASPQGAGYGNVNIAITIGKAPPAPSPTVAAQQPATMTSAGTHATAANGVFAVRKLGSAVPLTRGMTLSAFQRAIQPSAVPRDQTVASGGTASCPGGGTVTVTLDASSGDGSGSTSETMTETFTNCLENGEYFLNGSVTVRYIPASPSALTASETTRTNGTLSEVLYQSDGSSSAATVSYNNLAVTANYVAKMNGSTVGCGSVTYSVSGTVTVGGATYSPSASTFDSANSGSSQLPGC